MDFEDVLQAAERLAEQNAALLGRSTFECPLESGWCSVSTFLECHELVLDGQSCGRLSIVLANQGPLYVVAAARADKSVAGKQMPAGGLPHQM